MNINLFESYNENLNETDIISTDQIDLIKNQDIKNLFIEITNNYKGSYFKYNELYVGSLGGRGTQAKVVFNTGFEPLKDEDYEFYYIVGLSYQEGGIGPDNIESINNIYNIVKTNISI